MRVDTNMSIITGMMEEEIETIFVESVHEVMKIGLDEVEAVETVMLIWKEQMFYSWIVQNDKMN